MNRDRVQGGWMQLTGQVREQWGVLTHDRVDVLAGRRVQLAGRIQAQCGIAADAATRELNEFRMRNRNWKSV